MVVLIKDFDTAKQRLGGALGAPARRRLAVHNARLALRAARVGDRVLAVCGSEGAAELARQEGADVLLESRPAGQNPAARLGLEQATMGGAAAVLLLSSDLPLVRPEDVAEMMEAAGRLGSPAVMAAAANGRGGTNALYLRPPDAIGLHFGVDSLEKFAGDAARRGVRFELHESRQLALDLDEPSDLEALRVTR